MTLVQGTQDVYKSDDVMNWCKETEEMASYVRRYGQGYSGLGKLTVSSDERPQSSYFSTHT